MKSLSLAFAIAVTLWVPGVCFAARKTAQAPHGRNLHRKVIKRKIRAKRPRKPERPYDLMAPKPLDQVFLHLDRIRRMAHGANARRLQRAYQQLELRHYAQARALALPVLHDGLFSDYAHWIIAMAWKQEGESRAEADKTREGIAAAAEGAYEHFLAVQNGNPYSPLAMEAPRELGESELLLAYGSPPSALAVYHFENALERLAIHGGLYMVLPQETAQFAEACHRHPSDLCTPWLRLLTERMGRSSPEFHSIVKLFPKFRSKFHPGPSASHATQAYPSDDQDSKAFDDAMGSCLSGSWSDAIDKFTTFLQQFPKSAYRYRARYWLAVAQKKEGKDDDAKKQFTSLHQDAPLTYYGLLSSFAADEAPAQPITHSFPLAAERDPGLGAAETYHLHRAEILVAAHADDIAGMELKEIRARSLLSSPFLMYVAALDYRTKNFPSLFGLLSELIQRGYDGIASDIGLKMIFPVVQMKRIRKHAIENRINPLLVLSLIKQESAFDAHAVSGAGAAGLMQLMYFTAQETIPGITRTDLMEPERNIQTGTRYLAKLLERFHGNIVLSLAAYNAGPIAVERWVHQAEQQKYGMLEFIESIPYRETREYVSSIIRNYFWYSMLLKQDPPKSLKFFWAPYGSLNHEVGGPDVPANLFSKPIKKKT